MLPKTKCIPFVIYGLTVIGALLQLLSILFSNHVSVQQDSGDSIHGSTPRNRALSVTVHDATSINHGPVESIPHIMWFTYKHNILKTKEPRHYYENVMKTIHAYKTEWSDPNTKVYFLDDTDCMRLLELVDERENITLAKAFAHEEKGTLKADLCRLAALFLHGGYYFDVDLEVVRPVRLDSSVSFSTVNNSQSGFFFQAFLATSPGHPVIKTNLRIMMNAYFTGNENCMIIVRNILGPCTLVKAWDQTRHDGAFRLLEEIHLQQDELYPNMTQRGVGEHCHWVVHDRTEHEVYFIPESLEATFVQWRNRKTIPSSL
jgi:mannosyltransferase OCH1-like enzyme